jgi:GTP-binding nuclear protein Ran
MHKQFKLILVGDAGTGKSSWVRALHSEPPRKFYIPTVGVEVTSVTLPKKKITFKIWDTAGDPQYGGLTHGCHSKADCAIVFKTKSEVNTNSHIASLQKYCGNIPIIVVNPKYFTHSNLFEPLHYLEKMLRYNYH